MSIANRSSQTSSNSNTGLFRPVFTGLVTVFAGLSIGSSRGLVSIKPSEDKSLKHGAGLPVTVIEGKGAGICDNDEVTYFVKGTEESGKHEFEVLVEMFDSRQEDGTDNGVE